jgi:inosine/xanthosine triphosphate pyrophosphatase family protein
MELHIGSTNPAKIRQLAAAVAPAGATVTTLDPTTLPEVAEDAIDAIGNARAKAVAFAHASGRTCLAMDAALLLPDLGADQQPGVNVRRIPGAVGRPTDDQVLRYYTDLCSARGGRLRAHWIFGFVIAVPDGPFFVDETAVQRTLMTPPSKRRRDGYPLDSLQRDPATGRYLAEFTGQAEQELWQRTIGAPLQAFVVRTLERLRAGDVMR